MHGPVQVIGVESRFGSNLALMEDEREDILHDMYKRGRLYCAYAPTRVLSVGYGDGGLNHHLSLLINRQ